MISLAFLFVTVLFLLTTATLSFGLSNFHFHVFVDLPSILFILMGVAGYFCLFGRKEFRWGVKTFFAFSFPPDDHSPESGRFFLKLARFTLTWGLLGMVLGIILVMSNLDPDKMGPGVAICLLTFLYASGLALFVFLPIGLRLSPPTAELPTFFRFSAYHLILGLVGFFLVRWLVVLLVFAITLPPDARTGPISFGELGTVAQQAAFVLNPADPAGDCSPFPLGLRTIYLLWDVPGIILMVGSWWLFRMASGKRRRWIGAPVIVLIGLFWSIQCLVLMLTNLDPDTFGAGFAVTMLTTFYGFLAAIGFLIADMVSGKKGGVPSSPVHSEEIEQARQIIDRVVENERR